MKLELEETTSARAIEREILEKNASTISELESKLQAIQSEISTARSDRDLARAEVEALTARIRPHFLFNSLNNLYALTLLKHDKAPEVVLRLSSLMRFMLHDSEQETFTIRQEIQYLRDFAELEMLRFESKKDVTLDIQVADEDLVIRVRASRCVRDGQ